MGRADRAQDGRRHDVTATATLVGPTPQELRSAVRHLVETELAAGGFEPECDSWLIGFDRDFSRRLAAAGFIGTTLPRDLGGAGLSPLHRFVVVEELLAAGAPVAAHWFAERQIAPSLLKHGSAPLQQEWVPRIARGEACFAIGLSEPEAGSDLAAVRTRATRVAGGWRIDGLKVWSSNAHRADAIVVLARSSQEERKHQGLSQFIVRLPNPAALVSPIVSIDGRHHFNEVTFDGTFVPDADVLGKIGAGWHQVVSELAFERSGPERYLSTMPLLRAVVAALPTLTGRDLEDLGGLLSEMSALRRMSWEIAESMHDGAAPDGVAAAVVKDLGTRLEVRTVALAAELAAHIDAPDDPLRRLLAAARMQSPGFTLRGGTVEILRGIISKELVR
jgi:acyl-CoA dehydrogenase